MLEFTHCWMITLCDRAGAGASVIKQTPPVTASKLAVATRRGNMTFNLRENNVSQLTQPTPANQLNI